ncbi:MAG: hypothetical protein HYZ12_06345 [Thaumarchaeota archaeon]|nr:hypothetical protein [Nitrososphaerota archaeon]
MARSSALDREIIGLWKELSPSGAYTLGWNSCAGKLFVPTRQNIADALVRIGALKGKAENELQRKVLNGMETALQFEEPQPVLDDILGTTFNHLTKEGVKQEHLLSLFDYASRALDATEERFRGREVPTGVRALTLYRLDGVIEILDAIRGATKSRRLKDACKKLGDKTRRFVALFNLDGFGKGTFEEVEKVFQKYPFKLGRESYYPVALKEAFDYSETPEELEGKALSWIDEEMPKYRVVVKKLAAHYRCAADTETVEKKVAQKDKLRPADLVRLTNSIRRTVQRFVDKNVVRINKKYDTKVIETPPYLSGVLPTGAASFFDTFTKRPFQLYFVTTDHRRDPPKTVAQLLDLLVHEEYGHCVNNSNSALHFGGNASDLELIGTTHQGPVTEGLSFNREREFLEAVKKLEAKSTLTKVESEYVKLMKQFGGLELVNLEVELLVRKWRLIRFLRVVGDVRINSGKQSLFDFVDWANRHTDVPRSNIYYQLFPAHEGMFPGYATFYAVVGEEIRSIEEQIRDDRKRIAFSTYLTGIGYPPRSIYRRKLEEFVAKLE